MSVPSQRSEIVKRKIVISLQDALRHTQSENATDIRYNHTEAQSGYQVYLYDTSDFRLEFRVKEFLYARYRVRVDIIRNGERYTHGTSCEIYVKTAFEAIQEAIKETLIELKGAK